MIRFIRKKVYKIEWSVWSLHKNEILREALEFEYEVIMLYNNGNYYGYIELEHPLNIMISEFEPEFEPLELRFNDDIIEMAYAQFEKCRKLTLIPLKMAYKNDITVFMCIGMTASDYSYYQAALCVLDTYTANERTRKFFVEKFLGHKEGFVLSDLDEFTFKCFKILRKENVKLWCEGYLWPLVGIDTSDTELIPEEKIIRVLPENISLIGQQAYTQECVYAAEMLYRKGIDAYTLLIPSIEELEEISAIEEIMNKQLITFPKLIENHSTKLDKFFLKKFMGIRNHKEIEEIPENELLHPAVLGEGEATIYLIGACNVQGSTCLESTSLARILYKKCVDKSWKYKISRVVIPVMSMDVQQKVEELDIKRADKVFFICSAFRHDMSERCVDMKPVYNARKHDELFFSDFPMHTLRAGNEAIAECIISYIGKNESTVDETRYLQVSRPGLSSGEKKEILAYINSIKVNRKVCGGGGE